MGEASSAQKDFLDGLRKDRRELILVQQDIIKSKKKLAALQAAREALGDSIEISEENLDKISRSTKKWDKNTNNLKGQLDGINFDIEQLKRDLDRQKSYSTENSKALKSWRKGKKKHDSRLKALNNKYKSVLRSQKNK